MNSLQPVDEGPLGAPLSQKPPSDLLVVFIHGFKGTDSTFGGFPVRLQHLLTETIENVTTECILFPAYETKGELGAAVDRFVEWLTTLTVEREAALAANGSPRKVDIVLCGHSMGGLLAADTLLEIANSRPDSQAPLWPRIVACIAFDTPYFGIHPAVFKNGATEAIKYAQTAHSVATGVFGSLTAYGASRSTSAGSTSDVWKKLRPAAFAVGGALLAGAAGTAYYKRQDLGTGYTWVTDHMKYVKVLWDEEVLKKRMDDLMTTEKQLDVAFRTFYMILPPAPPTYRSERTFIVVPPTSSLPYGHFRPIRNQLAPDECDGHTNMFNASSNDGFYELGLQTALFIREVVTTRRSVGKTVAQARTGGFAVNDATGASEMGIVSLD